MFIEIDTLSFIFNKPILYISSIYVWCKF